jgi:hydrogenase expression/formation protein HypE
VVERGHGHGVFITTAGVGSVRPRAVVRPDRAHVGDTILVSGSIGRHGVAVMSVREGLTFRSTVTSDSAPIHHLVGALFGADLDVHVLRDPTRGGLAAVLNEIATASRVGVRLDEAAIPIDDEVRSACRVLGLDPLDVPSEGRLVAIVHAADRDRALAALWAMPGGENAVAIGTVVDEHHGMVVGKTAIGGTRIIDVPLGELLPRIC